ncbi:MAG: enoyl-CoA hydratase/isomerase family protein [Acidilobaceae archaeon]|nr:enoyl-CoA hydratase/isomerase family protein [Acidilobaceae archaeon]MCX8165164.1 enoyl-CoA hydratase/isomerase family protein [Acidilobaceae archaeon]MDW7974320.1 enoyl-CoA hydratase/isomerase family protein [Sulfolobales archaeon]
MPSVELRVEEGVGFVVLNRPEKLNALSTEVMEELIATLHKADEMQEVKVIALTGEGKFFSAGADLSEVHRASSPEEAERTFRTIAKLVSALMGLEKPLIMALNGDAYGGGAELIWTADIVIAVESAKLVWAEARWGYNAPVLPVIGPWVLGPSRTAMLAMTLEPLTAKEAHALGIISRLVPDQQALREEVKRIAKAIMENSPQGVRSIKRLLKLSKSSPLIELGLSELQRLARGQEAREAARAFVEKRKPSYSW